MEKHFAWRANKNSGTKKSSAWYWTVGVLVIGGALASIIIGNFLFGMLLLIGGFAVMLAGSQPVIENAYAISDKGLHINNQVIAWKSIDQFALSDNEPRALTVQTSTLFGTTMIPLNGVDHRGVRSVFLNNNIDEVDNLPAITEAITRAIGL